ncbi:hypothetical protein [uncultured Bacteroides sp.]|uniref:hypothetical protein n=1 Tax=uncultured Bacteroides sp. TaxID=162156 RepID=UPI002AA6EF77|nr:hypothetical protein [uncultured Bacteroides sp.]
MNSKKQLFDKYLTWRDNKAATEGHKYDVCSNEVSKETSFPFKFHHPDDSKRPIDLEIMLFHFVKSLGLD